MTCLSINFVIVPFVVDFHGSTFLAPDWYNVLNKTQQQAGLPDVLAGQQETNNTCRELKFAFKINRFKLNVMLFVHLWPFISFLDYPQC